MIISIGTFNVASFGFGLVAWGLPFVGARRRAKRPMHHYVVASLVCVVFALYFQLLATAYRVVWGDFAGIEDLAEFKTDVAGFLAATTLGLNYMCSGVRRRREEGDN